MTCTGNCNQGRACTCWRQDWADKTAYQPTHSTRENLLAVAVCVLLVIVTAVGWP